LPESYDVIIIGGGPAGLTAGLYTSRARLSTLLLERGLMGGQIVNAERVENYPGFPEGISGMELGERLHLQAARYGLETLTAEARGIELRGQLRGVNTDQGVLWARALIIAGGSEHRKLEVPGEKELLGRGVSYCATCDGPLFRDQAVAVVGGGDTALSDALYLSQFARRVTVIHRRDELRASRILQERAFARPRMDFLWNSVVEEVQGEDQVRGLRLREVKTGERSFLEVGGVFVAIGLVPNTQYLEGVLKLDDALQIETNESLEASLQGVFAAGDIRHSSARQAIAAAGDGAAAALAAGRFLQEQE
jgi:thioredoxin reductase (NADPH)